MSWSGETPGCVLVVEDIDVDYLIASRVIGRVWPGVRLLHACDGQAAIEMLERCEGESLPDLIFLDINMPHLDGHEFLDRYFADRRTIPVVAMLTSSKNPQDRARTEAHDSVKDYLVKPMRAEDLIRLAAALDFAA